MSILEDLDLLDLTADLPDEDVFNLEDILLEFSTPGLYEADVTEAPAPVAEVLPAADADPAPLAEESIPQFEYAPAPDAEAPAEDEEAYQGDLFGNPFGLGDILYEFGSPVDEDGVKVYNPAAKNTPAEDDEDNVRVYAPAAKAEAMEPAVEETVPFAAVPECSATAEAAPVPAPVEREKLPSLLVKAVGLVAGLLKRKKAPAKAADPAADPFADAVRLFEGEGSSDEDLGIDSGLMLELEMLAELAEEKAAALEAEEAEARIATTPDPEIEVPEAIALAQQEAEEAAAAAMAEAEAEEPMPDWLAAFMDQAPAEAPEEAAEDQAPAAAPTVEMHVWDIEEAEGAASTEDAEEESSEEIRSLLENPDIDPASNAEAVTEVDDSTEPTDDDLHYKPDAPIYKQMASRIGKRFGSVFGSATESAEGEDEDDLGPEVSPVKAYRYFNQFVNGYRFRLRIAAALSVVLAWISLGLPVFSSMKNPAVAAAMCLMLQLTIMLAGADIIATGFTGLLRKEPGLHSLVVISCFASIIDAAVIIMSKGQGGYLPFCGVSAISVCFAIYGSLLYSRSQRLNFKVLAETEEPLTVSVGYGIMDEETTTVYRSIGHPEQYIHRSEEEDLSETLYGLVTPFLLVGIPVLAVFAALLSKGSGDFFHILAAMFSAAASFSALVAFPLPYFLVQNSLYQTRSAIAGWSGARDIGKVSTMIITDRDLFPDETVSIKSVGIVNGVSSDLTLSYFCSMIRESGSCLAPAFEQLAENHNCVYREVHNFQCHEAGGLSATIGPDEVVIASHSYMKLQGYRLPIRKKDSENALFMAANGHVIACIVMEYKPIKSVRAGLESALRGNVELVFAARDFNITPLLISKMFRSATDTILFPSYKQRYEITDHKSMENSSCAAVVSRKSLFSYAAVVEKARYLYRSVTLSVALSLVSSAMGVVLMFIMALTGAGTAVTVGRLLIFMLLWLVPTLALTVSITK